MKIHIRMTDLWGEPEGGWSENASWVNTEDIVVPDDASDLAICRRIKSTIGCKGWRRDDWCHSDFGPWRNGCMGVYADIIEENIAKERDNA